MRRWTTGLLTILATTALVGAYSDVSRGEARGPYPVGWMDVQVPGTSGTFPATLFYPAQREGAAAPVHGSAEAFPALSFAHGYQEPVDSYASSLTHLASHGYIVIAARSRMGPLPYTEDFARDVVDTTTFLTDESRRQGSLLHERIRTDALGLLGHSLGGGACIMAAAQDPRIKALVLWAPATPVGSRIPIREAAAALRIPVQIVAGSDDVASSILFEILPVAAAMPPPGQLLMMWGGTHWGFLDLDRQVYNIRTIFLGEAQLNLAQETARGFFDVHLRHDNRQWGQVWGPLQFFRPGVLVFLNPGLQMAPYSLVTPIPAGGTAILDVQLVSTSPRETEYDVVVYTECGAVTVSPKTVTLAPGESKWVEVRVAIPTDQPAGDATIVLTARSKLDRATRAYALAFARVYAH